MAASTALGRVQPLFKGDYDSNSTYQRLDNVLYQGSTWLCKVDGIIGITPSAGPYWQLVASKGDQGIQGMTGSFGTTDGTVTMHSADDPTATVVVTNDGPDTGKNFHFAFDLPKGPKGFDAVSADATSLQPGDTPTAAASLSSSGGTTTLEFNFGIPAADGEGVKSVDGILPTLNPDTGLQDVQLKSVRYVSQSLSEGQKTIVRTNIGAQVAGEYIVDPSASSGQFLQYNNEGHWVGSTINLVPSGSSSDVGKYLRKTGSGMLWAEVQSLPSGGSENAPLIKNSADNYDVTWGSLISHSEIDNIVNE